MYCLHNTIILLFLVETTPDQRHNRIQRFLCLRTTAMQLNVHAILTDMFGGTPSNLAISVMKPDKVEVIAGVNVPMLIKLISVRNTMSLMNAALTAQEAGRKYINVASNLLKKAS